MEGQDDAVAHVTGETVDTLLPDLLEVSNLESVEDHGTPSGKPAETLRGFPASGTFPRGRVQPGRTGSEPGLLGG